MKSKTCCFTGHRNIPQENYGEIYKKTKQETEKLIKQGFLYFCAGGALGFDTVAASVVLELREKYNEIQLILILPCYSQTRGWSKKDRDIYEDIRGRANKVIYTSQEYTRGCMHKRNRCLADSSCVCLCYLTSQRGGTYYTVNYAKNNGVSVINVAELI